MKYLLIILSALLFISCNTKEKTAETQEPSVIEQIANAHGFEHWHKVQEVQFKFGKNRLWNWNPKTNDVKLTTSNDTINYSRNAIDSLSINADRAFINDKFWLLIPFQLVWDTGTEISEPIEANAPISKTAMKKITITYSSEGGYTPGDAYDIYFDNDFIIREWVFRKGNQTEPSITNTFENYKDFNGIKIATEHKKEQGDWNIILSNIKITLIE